MVPMIPMQRWAAISKNGRGDRFFRRGFMMDNAIVSAIASAFVYMIPIAAFIGICTRIGRMIVRAFSGKEDFF